MAGKDMPGQSRLPRALNIFGPVINEKHLVGLGP